MEATPEQMRAWIKMRQAGSNDFDLDEISRRVDVAAKDDKEWYEDADIRVNSTKLRGG